jgi:uncharacterized lipoprotein YbaY
LPSAQSCAEATPGSGRIGEQAAAREDEAVVIAGTILLAPPADLDGAVAEVRLVDAALADAPARTVAMTRLDCAGRRIERIPFRLAARVAAGKGYGIEAEVRKSGGNRLEPGDLRTMQSYGWRSPGKAGLELAVEEVI